MAKTHIAVFAHRGDIDHWPENTLESVTAASQTTADGIEFDVHKSADGTWWLLHDAELDRTTGGRGNISEYRDADLEALSVEQGPALNGGPGVRLTRLSTVLLALRGYRGILIFDVKERDASSHAEIARLAPAGSYIICRDVAGASAVKTVDTTLTTISVDIDVRHPDVDVLLAQATVGAFWPRSDKDRFLTRAMFVNVDEQDGRVDELPLLEQGRRWGVAFVISNHLDAALAWRDAVARP